MKTLAIPGMPREISGKSNVKALRREGKVPCVLYGGEENLHFSVEAYNLRDLIYTPDFKKVELEINGEKTECILKDVQFHPVTDTIEHVDFLRIAEGRPVKVEIPVRFKGLAAGLKSGGKLIQKMRKVKIKTTPDHLVDELVLDISHLNLGQTIRVRDIKLEEGVELLNNMATPLASVEIPRALRSLTAEEEEAEREAEEGAEGEEGEEKKGEEKKGEETSGESKD